MLWYIVPSIVTGLIGYFVGRRGFMASVKDIQIAVEEVKTEAQKK